MENFGHGTGMSPLGEKKNHEVTERLKKISQMTIN